MQSSIFEVESDNTDTFAVLHQQVKSEVFDEEVGVVSKRLSVESVENGVTSSVGGSGTSVGLTTFTEVEGLTTESTLVDLALFSSRERDTVVFKLQSISEHRPLRCSAHLNDCVWRFSTHVVDSVLVSQPIRSFDRVVPDMSHRSSRSRLPPQLTCAISSHPPSCYRARR